MEGAVRGGICPAVRLEEEREGEEERLWDKVESQRHLLTKSINPSKLTAYLRQCKVIDEEDEDEVLHSLMLTSRRARASRLLDILRSRGKRGYEAFLESLELYYAEMYKLITGKEPTRGCSVLVVEEGYEGLTQFLMSEALKVQRQLKDRDAEIHKLQAKCQELAVASAHVSQQNQELQGVQERHRKLKEEIELFNNQLNKVREDSYLLAMKHAQLHEEKNMVAMRNRELQLENDQMRWRLTGVQEECMLARRVSSKLQEDMDSLPSRQSVSKLHLDNQQLRTTVQQLQTFLQSKTNLPCMDKTLLDIMDHDRQEALEDRQTLVDKFHHLNLELQQAEELRDKYLSEKEDLGVQATLVTKQCQMQEYRINTLLKQIQEVEKERDQALRARDEAQTIHAQLLVDVSRHRRQVWGLEEKMDLLHLELARKDGEMTNLHSQLKELRSCNLHLTDLNSSVSSSLDSINCPEDPSSEDHREGRSFPSSGLSRRNCVKRLELSSGQSPQFPESDHGEESSTMEDSWHNMDDEQGINRFSMIPFPPGKDSLLRRLKDVELVSRYLFGPLRNSMEFGNSCPDEMQKLPHNKDIPFPGTEDMGKATIDPDGNKRPLSSSLSMPDLTSICTQVQQGRDPIIARGNGAAILVNCEHQRSWPQEGYQLLGQGEGSVQRIAPQNCAGTDAFGTLPCRTFPESLPFSPIKACRPFSRVFEVDGQLNGNSFYIRVNLNILGQVDSCSLQVKCDEILHILNTACPPGSDWLCARVDPVTMSDQEQGTIPSANRAHRLLMVKIHSLIGNFQKNERAKKAMKNYNELKSLGGDQVRIVVASLPNNVNATNVNRSLSFCHEDRNERVVPYSLVHPVSVRQKRPVVIMPTVLAKPLMHRILQSPTAADFQMVQAEVFTEEQLKNQTRFPLQKVLNQDKYECITLEAIRDVIAKNKHGLLPLGVHSVKDLITEEIYSIIIHIKVTPKNMKKLRKLAPKSCGSDAEFLKLHRIEQKHLESVPCLSAAVEPGAWATVDELAKAVRDSIVQEQQKVVWVEQN
ncbi:caspase recruitment domain-containing protein 11-like [Amblyraja radiata]|uniref:caspase recruitment domain-containing protein 11-like n=1 Tax=Amblyraja radiata TaxID=386614 RepID=UPI0014024DF3|nr:caspase recruitment domain-containing protein 11-like [Amblyraja radiata]